MRDQLILVYSYLHGIWHYRWSALLISSVIAIIGWVGVYIMPDQYASHAVVHVDTKSVMQPLLEGLAVESEIDTGINIMTRVLLSRKNLEEVIRHTDMDIEVNTPEEMEKLVYGLASSIELKLDSKSKRQRGDNIYVLSYEGNSPERVYQVVSKLLNTLIENTLDSMRMDTAGAQIFIDDQITKYELRLAKAEQRLAEFKRANVGFMPDENGGYYRRLQKEESTVASIRSDLRLAIKRHSTMIKQLAGEAPLLDNANNGAPRAMKLRKYRNKLEQLLISYKDQHPDVMAVRATIAEILASDTVVEYAYVDPENEDLVEFNPVYQEIKVEINSAKVEVETLKIKLKEQEVKVQSLKQAVDILPGVEAELAKLDRDYKITRDRYLSFVKRRESAQLAQAIEQSGSNIKFRIIEPPRVPSEPSGPDRLYLLTVVFFVAIAAGLGWGFLRYLIRPTFIDSSQIKDNIGLPILGSVGLYMTTAHRKKRRLQLTGFLATFFLLVIMYSAAMFYSGSRDELVNAFAPSSGAMT